MNVNDTYGHEYKVDLMNTLSIYKDKPDIMLIDRVLPPKTIVVDPNGVRWEATLVSGTTYKCKRIR